jgi:putative oxidoreductase
MDETVNDGALLLGRLLLATLFVVEGFSKIWGYQAALGYMQHFSLPAVFLPPAIAVEIVGGTLLALGWHSRWAAFAVAGFSGTAALLFHTNFADRGQLIHLEKDLAIAGGLLTAFACGPGRFSIERLWSERTTGADARGAKLDRTPHCE